jgi:hypothetical protein
MTFDEAVAVAEKYIDRADICKDYKSYYFFVRDSEVEKDTSEGMIAVSKEDGECANFVAVIPELGKCLGVYRRDDDGVFRQAH